MAAAWRQVERGVYNFTRKTWSRYALKSASKRGRNATHASRLWTARLLSDAERGERTRTATEDSYTRTTPLPWGRGKNSENHCHPSTKEGSYHKETLLGNIGRNLCQCRARFRRSTHTSGRCLCLGQFVFIRSFSGEGAWSEPLYKTKTGYYEILEVSPTATQAQIKTAYYKQSFIYHPDRNAGSDEATVRFSDINEAYTVLGNKALRRKYDKGLLSQSDLLTSARPSGKDQPRSSARQQTDSRRSVMGQTSQEQMFNFDKFYKSHYQEQLQRDKDIKVRKEAMTKRKGENAVDKMSWFTELGPPLTLLLALIILLSMRQR